MAFSPQALDEEAAAVVVLLCPTEGLLPVGLAIGAAPALDDVEMSPRLTTQLEVLGLEACLHLLLMNLGGGVDHVLMAGN